MGQVVPVFQTPKATSNWLATLKPQMELALPKFMNVDRMALEKEFALEILNDDEMSITTVQGWLDYITRRVGATN